MIGSEWCKKYGVTFDWSANGYQRDKSGWEYHDFTLTLSREGVTLTLPYKAGLLNDDEITADLLSMHGQECATGSLDWDDYASEYGIDPEGAPLSYYRTWESLRKMHAEVYEFCTSQAMWEDFCQLSDPYDTEDN